MYGSSLKQIQFEKKVVVPKGKIGAISICLSYKCSVAIPLEYLFYYTILPMQWYVRTSER